MTLRSSITADEIKFLAGEILRHKALYYSGTPEISDAEYDLLEDRLRALSPEHAALKLIGTNASSPQLQKRQHKSPMLSLSKTYDLDELKKWANNRSVVGSYKIDGNSLSLIYEKGSLVLAKTRGDGFEGEDVTDKVNWVLECVPKLKDPLDLEVRGELYCAEESFFHMAAFMEHLGLEKPSNPRNTVAGTLGRKTHPHLARFFQFFAFDVIAELPFKDEMQKMAWLESQGFKISPHSLLETSDALEPFSEKVKTAMAQGDIGLDGVVFTFNDLLLQKSLGSTAHHPRYKMSYKWAGETAIATIEDIIWATSRLGIVTPVAKISPVILSGAQIQNVTLHNASYVKLYELKAKDRIEIIRSGEVIPKFLRVVSSSTNSSCIFPNHCPSCEGELTFDDVRLVCQNTSCPAQNLGQILNWVSVVGIEDLSEKRLAPLIELGLVNDPADLYKITLDDLLRLPLTKEKMATKLLKNIEAKKDLPLSVFLTGLGISGAGKTTWDLILSSFQTLEALYNATPEDLLKIKGIGEKTSLAIVGGLQNKKQMISKLFDVGLTTRYQIRDQGALNPNFHGKSFVVSGAMSVPRDKIFELIKNAGGEVHSSVTKKTSTLLLAEADSSSSKAIKAKQLGVAIWGEADFWKNLKSL